MTAAQLILELAKRGITIESVGNRLRYSPQSLMTPDLASQIAAVKPELLAILDGGNDAVGEGATNSSSEIDWFDYLDRDDCKRLLGPREYPDPCRYCGMRSKHWSKCPASIDDEISRLPAGRYGGRKLSQCPTNYLRQIRTGAWYRLSPFLQNEISRVVYLREHFQIAEESI